MNTTTRFLASAALLGASFACRDSGGPELPKVVAVRVTPGADTLASLGQRRQYSAQALDGAGHPIPGKTVAWSVLDPAVVSVQSGGVVQALANGMTRVRASIDGLTGEAAVVVAQRVATVALTPGTRLLAAVDDTARFTATARDANGNPIVAARFVWVSADHAVATVDSAGLVRARGNGGTTVTAAADGIPGYAGVTVSQVPAALVFCVQPTDHRAGEAMAQAVEVDVVDAAGARVRGIRLAIALLPLGGGPPLHGTTMVTSQDGVAVFPGLYQELAGTDYQLVASATGLNGDLSVAYRVDPGPVAHVAVSVQPEVIVDSIFTVSVSATDAYGNATAGPVGIDLAARPWPDAEVRVLGSLAAIQVNRPGDGYRIRARIGPAVGESDPFHARLYLTQVATGAYHSCGLSFQRAYCWGAAASADTQLAVDSVPRAVPTDRRFIKLAVGAQFGCGIEVDATVRCWGFGPLGDGSFMRVDPQPVAGALTFADVSAGATHVCGVRSDGVYCWGANRYGQVGDGTVTDKPTPVLVISGAFTGVAAGFAHTCARSAADSVYCWGDNRHGQLGVGDTVRRLTPTRAAPGRTFVELTAGAYHTCGRGIDRKVYCWGSNLFGQLGDSTTTDRWLPVLVSQGFPYDRVSAGGVHTCAATLADLRCWGSNLVGQLGNGGNGALSAIPVLTALISPDVQGQSLSTGLYHTCVSKGAGGIYCWGLNAYGEVGDGTLTAAFVPHRVVQ